MFGIIPENRLRECFDRAFKDRKSDGFPVSAYDLNDAWKVIEQEDARQREYEHNRRMRERPIDFCPEPDRHVDADGNVEVLLGGPGGREVVVPCPLCRTLANAQRMAELRRGPKFEIAR